jgi:hypothetical protein
MTKLTRYGVLSATLTMIIASCFASTVKAQDATTPAAAPATAAKPAAKKAARKKGNKLKAAAAKDVAKGAKTAGEDVKK